MALLEIEKLTKRFGSVVANNEVTLSVEGGQVFGLLGHNGAGKTTLINQAVGISRPDAGSIRMCDFDAVAHPAKARQVSAIQAQGQIPMEGLTPKASVELIGRIRGGGRREIASRADELARRLDLGQWWDRRLGQLSGGAIRLTAFAMAIVQPKPLVFLDEPTNDVDPVRRQLVWNEIRRVADEGAGVVLVTHNVVEAERVVDQLALLDSGRVVTRGTPSALGAALSDELRLDLRWQADRETPALPSGSAVVAARRGALSARVPADQADHFISWAMQLRTNGEIESFGLTPVTLEDVYTHTLNGENQDEEVAA